MALSKMLPDMSASFNDGPDTHVRENEGHNNDGFANDWFSCIFGCKISENQQVINLKCLHFICSDSCVTRLKHESKSSKLECKECSAVIESEDLTLKHVPHHLLFKKKALIDVNFTCENCIWGRPGTSYCAECPAYLCNQCKELHPQMIATRTHVVVDNLEDLKEKYIAKLKEEESKCKTHSQMCASYCHTCDVKICDMCLPDHATHVASNVESKKKELISKGSLARKLMEKLDLARKEIGSKRDVLSTVEFDRIKNEIEDHFESMILILAKRKDELIRKANDLFTERLSILHMRSKCANLSKSSTERFVQVVEEILENRDDTACAVFLKQYENYLQWLSETDKKFTTQFDRYTDKGCGFLLDTSSNIEATKCLSEHCQLEYRCTSGDQGDLETLPSALSNTNFSTHSNCQPQNLEVVATMNGINESDNQCQLLCMPDDDKKNSAADEDNKSDEHPTRLCIAGNETQSDELMNIDTIDEEQATCIKTEFIDPKSSFEEITPERRTYSIDGQCLIKIGVNETQKEELMNINAADKGQVTCIKTEFIVQKSSFEEITPESCDFPIQGRGQMKISNADESEDYCAVCRDGGDETMVCCDFCPKVFHLKCHLPILNKVPEDEAKWRCNYETSKESVLDEISQRSDFTGSEGCPLTESNERHYLLACKFVMECYKIPESPTIRFLYPEGFLLKYGTAPVHLKYIRERLCLGQPEHFTSVIDFMLAFQSLFTQAAKYYESGGEREYRQAISACFKKFLILINEYYPAYRRLFTNIEFYL